MKSVPALFPRTVKAALLLACKVDIGTIESDMKGSAKASSGHKVVRSSRGVVELDSNKYPFCYPVFA
jgi:hypothetical protein